MYNIINSWNDTNAVFRRFGNWFNKILGNVVKQYTGSGMTDADKEAADLSLTNTQTLNEEDYQRKIDFYERYESPEAQVRQYKNAGLNPALLYGNGASVSASGGIGTGSAGASAAAPTDLIGSLSSVLGVFNQKQKIKNDFEIEQMRNTIEAHKVKVQEEYNEVLKRNIEANTTGTQLNNDFLQETFFDRVQGAHNEAELKANMSKNLISMVEQRSFQNNLYDAQTGLTRMQINLVSAQITGQMLQNAILHAQEKYADKYFKATAALQTALSQVQAAQGTFLEKTLNTRIKMAETELSNLIIRAGMDARVFNGEAFEKQVQGKMTDAEKTQFWIGAAGSAVKTAVTGAVAAYGAGMLAPAAAGAVSFGSFAAPVW